MVYVDGRCVQEFVLLHMFVVGITFSVGLGVSGMSNQVTLLAAYKLAFHIFPNYNLAMMFVQI